MFIMWLFYNRFTISRKIDDPSNHDLVDEIGEMCYQWAITRPCFSYSPKFSEWKSGMDRTWPNSKSLPHLVVQDKVIDAPLDWIDLPDYFCEFRDLRFTLKQKGDIKDKDYTFIHHIHIKRVDDVVEFSILQETPTDEDSRDWEEIDIYPPMLIHEIITKYDCEIKDYKIKNSHDIINQNFEVFEENIFDQKRRLPLVVIPEFFAGEYLNEQNLKDFTGKITGFGELWIFKGERYGDEFQSFIKTDEDCAIIFSPGLDARELSNSNKVNKITKVAFNHDFMRTSNDIVNEVLRRTRSMNMRSHISKMVSDAISENIRKIDLEKEQKKIEEIINENNSVEEKNKELVSQIRIMSNKMLEANNEISVIQRENQKLTTQRDGFRKKYQEYKSQFHEIKYFRDEIEVKAREKNLSVSEVQEKIRIAFDENEGFSPPEIEHSSIFDLVRDSSIRYPKIIFSPQALRSAKNADNTGRYGSDDIQKIHESFQKLNNHFFKSNDIDLNNLDFHKEISNIFPGKYSNESSVTIANMKNYSGNDRRIFPVIFPEKGEMGVEMTWHIKPTSTFRINICYMKYGNWDIPLWSNLDGKWYRNFKKEKGTTFGKNKEDYPKIIIGYCGHHLKTFSTQ